MFILKILVLYGTLTSAIQLQDTVKSFNERLTAFSDSNGWSAFGGSDAHTGYRGDYLGQVEGFIKKWSISVDGTFTYPIVHDNKVFVMTSTGVLHVFDELTGTQLGLINLGSGSYVGPPTFGNDGEDDLVYVQMYRYSEDIAVFAVKIQPVYSMHLKWITDSSSLASIYQYGVASSKSSGFLYYAGGNYGNEMYAVNYTTGVVEFDSVIHYEEFSTDNWAPTVDEQGRVFFSAGSNGDCGYIGEVDPLSGNVIWNYPLNTAWFGYSTYWVPVVSSNIALAVVFETSSQASLVAVSLISHTMLWTTDVCPVVDGEDVTPAVDGTHVFFSCTDGIRSFSLLTGNLSTKYLPCEGCFGQPIVTEDYLFGQSSNGTVVFDKTTGDLAAEALDGSGKMAYNSGSVYVSVKDTLFAYEIFSNNITNIAE